MTLATRWKRKRHFAVFQITRRNVTFPPLGIPSQPLCSVACWGFPRCLVSLYFACLRHQRLRTCFRNSAVFFILDDAGAGSGACRRQVAFRDIHTSLRAGVDFPLHVTHHSRWWLAEVAGVTFSDSATVPEFLNPGPAIFQIRKSDSCSDSAATVIDLPENGHWPSRLLLLPKWKSDSGSGFS